MTRMLLRRRNQVDFADVQRVEPVETTEVQRLHEKVEASLGPWIFGSDLVHAVQRWHAGSFAADVESELFAWQACIKLRSANV